MREYLWLYDSSFELTQYDLINILVTFQSRAYMYSLKVIQDIVIFMNQVLFLFLQPVCTELKLSGLRPR